MTGAGRADVSGCLRAFADEFARYEGLRVVLLYRAGDAGALWVTPEDAPELSEELVCVEEDGRVEYLWRWGEPIAGEDLRAKAAEVARILEAERFR